MRPAATAVAAAALLAAGTARADTINFSAVFAQTGASLWDSGPALQIDTGTLRLGPDPWNLGKTVGGFVNPCDPFGTCNTGAKIGADTNGNMGLEYGVKFNSGSFDTRYPVIASLTTPSSPTALNTPFTIGSSFSVPGLSGAKNSIFVNGLGGITATQQTHSPTFQAFVDLKAQFHAFAGAQACVLGVCQGPSTGDLAFDKSQTLVDINRNNDGLIQLGGQTVKLKQDFTAVDGDVTARLNIPNIDAILGGGSTATSLVSTGRDNIVALDANVANIASKAFGIPLVGNLGPIGYDLLNVNAGLALDVRQTITTQIIPIETLHFGSNVEQYLNGQWSAPTNTISFQLGQSVTLRSNAVFLGVVPTVSLEAQTTNRTDLLLTGDFSLQAGGFNAFGQSIGPLFDSGNLQAGLIDIPVYQKTFDLHFGDMTGQAFTMEQGYQSFNPNSDILGTLAQSFQVNSGVGFNSLIDFDANGCTLADVLAGGCTGNPIFLGQLTKFATDENGDPIYLTDGSTVPLPGNDPGPFSDDQTEQGLLADTGYNANGLPPFDIPPGAPPLPGQIVPEPGTWALMLLGLGFVGAVARRRSAIAASA